MKKSGTSLAELLITLATLSIALGLIAGLVSQYQRLLFRDSSQSLVAAQFQQVNLIRAELAQATQILQPSNATPSDELIFYRVDPQAPRLDGNPTPTSWAPLSSALSLQVRYYLDSQQLRRGTQKGAVQTDEALLHSIGAPVAGFAAHLESDGRIVINFSFQERDVLRNLACEVLPWAR